MDEKVKKIVIGSDHAGFLMKEEIKEFLKKYNYLIEDFGTFSENRVDYPDIAVPLAEAVHLKKFEFGILLCGSGNGMAITANKFVMARAAICWSEEITKLARMHNDANIMALPARFITIDMAIRFTDLFLNTGFEGGRHQTRVDKISKLISVL